MWQGMPIDLFGRHGLLVPSVAGKTNLYASQVIWHMCARSVRTDAEITARKSCFCMIRPYLVIHAHI